jgi:hypothetical protein
MGSFSPREAAARQRREDRAWRAKNGPVTVTRRAPGDRHDEPVRRRDGFPGRDGIIMDGPFPFEEAR